MKPFLRWAGGKAKLADQIISYFPADMHLRTYREPFLGGGAVFFRLMETKTWGPCVLSDVEPKLIATYRGIAEQSDTIRVNLNMFAKCHEKDPKGTFSDLRDSFNSVSANDLKNLPTRLLVATYFIYLNKACFNGLYRTNKKGDFNVPIGDKPPSLNMDLQTYARILASARIECMGFMKALGRGEVAPGDVVYADPPYVPLSTTSNFTGYAGGFSMEDQKQLAQRLRELDEMGCIVVASNSDTPETRELYKGFELVELDVQRSVGAAGGTRKRVGELIIRGKTRA